MLHARKDYQRIQDPEGKIPEDEPVFLLRAQDVCAPFIVLEWAHRAGMHGAANNIVNAARSQAERMRQWQREHGMKVPDLPGGDKCRNSR